MANDRKKSCQGSPKPASNSNQDAKLSKASHLDNTTDVIKQMNIHHSEMLDKVQNMSDNTLEKLILYVDKSHTSIKAYYDLQMDAMRTEMFNLNSKMDTVMNEKEALLKKVDETDKYVKTIEKELENARDEADEIQINVNRPYLVVNNFKPVQNKTDEEAFTEFCNLKMNDVNVAMIVDNIAKLHRVKRGRHSHISDTSRAETMIVKFKEEKHRDTLFRNKRKLARSGTTFTELLPQRRKQLLNKCIQDLPTENRSLWTDGGKILVAYARGSDQIVHIKSTYDIQQLKDKIFRGQQESSQTN